MKDREQAAKDRHEAESDRKQAEKDRAQAEKDRAQAGKDRAQAEVDRKHAEEDRKLFESMMNEVVAEKLADNREAIKSLSLDDDGFTINGVQQSKELHDKFKAKYLKKKGSRISFKNESGYRRISID